MSADEKWIKVTRNRINLISSEKIRDLTRTHGENIEWLECYLEQIKTRTETTRMVDLIKTPRRWKAMRARRTTQQKRTIPDDDKINPFQVAKETPLSVIENTDPFQIATGTVLPGLESKQSTPRPVLVNLLNIQSDTNNETVNKSSPKKHAAKALSTPVIQNINTQKLLEEQLDTVEIVSPASVTTVLQVIDHVSTEDDTELNREIIEEMDNKDSIGKTMDAQEEETMNIDEDRQVGEIVQVHEDGEIYEDGQVDDNVQVDKDGHNGDYGQVDEVIEVNDDTKVSDAVQVKEKVHVGGDLQVDEVVLVNEPIDFDVVSTEDTQQQEVDDNSISGYDQGQTQDVTVPVKFDDDNGEKKTVRHTLTGTPSSAIVVSLPELRSPAPSRKSTLTFVSLPPREPITAKRLTNGTSRSSFLNRSIKRDRLRTSIENERTESITVNYEQKLLPMDLSKSLSGISNGGFSQLPLTVGSIFDMKPNKHVEEIGTGELDTQAEDETAILDNERARGDQRLKSMLTTGTEKIWKALNSLRSVGTNQYGPEAAILESNSGSPREGEDKEGKADARAEGDAGDEREYKEGKVTQLANIPSLPPMQKMSPLLEVSKEGEFSISSIQQSLQKKPSVKSSPSFTRRTSDIVKNYVTASTARKRSSSDIGAANLQDVKKTRVFTNDFNSLPFKPAHKDNLPTKQTQEPIPRSNSPLKVDDVLLQHPKSRIPPPTPSHRKNVTTQATPCRDEKLQEIDPLDNEDLLLSEVVDEGNILVGSIKTTKVKPEVKSLVLAAAAAKREAADKERKAQRSKEMEQRRLELQKKRQEQVQQSSGLSISQNKSGVKRKIAMDGGKTTKTKPQPKVIRIKNYATKRQEEMRAKVVPFSKPPQTLMQSAQGEELLSQASGMVASSQFMPEPQKVAGEMLVVEIPAPVKTRTIQDSKKPVKKADAQQNGMIIPNKTISIKTNKSGVLPSGGGINAQAKSVNTTQNCITISNEPIHFANGPVSQGAEKGTSVSRHKSSTATTSSGVSNESTTSNEPIKETIQPTFTNTTSGEEPISNKPSFKSRWIPKLVDSTVPSETIELPEVPSEYSDSEDEDERRKKKAKIPEWAKSPELRAHLARQAHVDPDIVFGPIKPIKLEEIFGGTGKKFRARTSSGNWTGNDRLTIQEQIEYQRVMGYRDS